MKVDYPDTKAEIGRLSVVWDASYADHRGPIPDWGYHGLTSLSLKSSSVLLTLFLWSMVTGETLVLNAQLEVRGNTGNVK